LDAAHSDAPIAEGHGTVVRALDAAAAATDAVTLSLAGLRTLAVLQLAGGSVLLAERVVGSLRSSPTFANSKASVALMGIAMLCMVSLFVLSSVGLDLGSFTQSVAPRMADTVMVLGMMATAAAVAITVKDATTSEPALGSQSAVETRMTQ
jgi:hypothetical protein